MERKKRGEISEERERKGGVIERDRWGSEWVRERGRLLNTEREREREEERKTRRV